ncbi:MAG: LytR C-terminal domain-containing protein [Propionicimonas sp.]|nr:LytR C-terminal domain-containing protein [Propionicimonas sp.]MEA5119420.1 LytR C-terminal domain-containing protein [Propionicimonas sp.]
MDSARKIFRLVRTPVTLILLLCIIGYGAKWGYDKATEPIPPRPPTPCTMFDVGKELTPRWVTARVLNGGTQGGLARNTALNLRAFGFTVIKVNNTEERITNTVIVGSSADDPEVQLLMNFFEDATARGDGRVDHVVDVLVGNDTVRVTDPKVRSVKVDGKVCLPADTKVPTPLPTPTPSPKKKG